MRYVLLRSEKCRSPASPAPCVPNFNESARFGFKKILPSEEGPVVVRSCEVHFPKAANFVLRAVSQWRALDNFADHGVDGNAPLSLCKHLGGSGN